MIVHAPLANDMLHIWLVALVSSTGIIDSASDSLFYYDGSSFGDFHDPSFTPVFEVAFTDPTLQSVAEEMCQGDMYCLFDIAATGDPSIRLTTLAGVQELDEMVEASRPGGGGSGLGSAQKGQVMCD